MNASDCSEVGRPKWTVLVVSQVPSRYCPPESLEVVEMLVWLPQRESKANLLEVRGRAVDVSGSELLGRVMR